jgi:hypothetical protein
LGWINYETNIMGRNILSATESYAGVFGRHGANDRIVPFAPFFDK